MPDDPTTFDLVVIGAGPAGENAAVTAAHLGKRVAVVEKTRHLGGAAINTGTVPSKTLRETALALSGLKSRETYGVDLAVRGGATVADFLRHERRVRADERDQLRGLLDRYGVAVFHGAAAFADPHTVRVTADDGVVTDLRAGRVVVATGSVPVRPPGVPFAHDRVHDSDELINMHQMPRSLAVVGAGVIGCEYACMFAALGVETHLVDGRDKLLPFLDADLSAALEREMTGLGVRFAWNESVEACPDPGDGPVRLALSSGRVLEVDQALVCAGRESRTAELNPAAAGLAVGPKGRLAVNDRYQTNVPHVYAVGDVVGFPALASTSAEQGRVAACHAFESLLKTEIAPVLPSGIYTIPEVSAAGQTEKQARDAGEDVIVGRADYGASPRGKIIGDRTGFLKLVFRRADMRLLGVHVIGEQATEVVHIGVMALMQGSGADVFLRTCFNYPTLGELYKLATHDALIQKWGGGPVSGERRGGPAPASPTP